MKRRSFFSMLFAGISALFVVKKVATKQFNFMDIDPKGKPIWKPGEHFLNEEPGMRYAEVMKTLGGKPIAYRWVKFEELREGDVFRLYYKGQLVPGMNGDWLVAQSDPRLCSLLTSGVANWEIMAEPLCKIKTIMGQA